MKILNLNRALILSTALLLFSTLVHSETVVVIASASSPVSKLDKEQVANLFLGKSSSYPEAVLLYL